MDVNIWLTKIIKQYDDDVHNINWLFLPSDGLNEEWTGKCLRQVEYISGHLWHRYAIAVNHVMVATVKLSKWDFNWTKWNPWFSSFLFSTNPLSRKSWYAPQALDYRINWEIYTPYAGAAVMVLHMNGKFTMRKLKSSLLLQILNNKP